MRILHAVELYRPSTGGAQEVVRQISERLAAEGHEVTVATSTIAGRPDGPLGGVQVEQFDVTGNAVRGMTGDVDRYQRFVIGGNFDVVLTYAAQQWTTDALLPVLDEIDAPTVLAPCGFSRLHDPAYSSYFEELAPALGKFTALVLHTDSYQDAEFVRASGADNVYLIPNGADKREFGVLAPRERFRKEWGIGIDAPLLLTVGGHTGLKGHEQSMRAFLAADSMAGGTLAILANHPTGPGCGRRCRVTARARNFMYRDRRIIVADPARDAVVEAFSAADLFLFCSMVECSPLVLFEAMAAGLPFASLDVGNAQEIANWGSGGLIVETAHDRLGLATASTAEVASAIDGLMADTALRDRMRASARDSWQERFTWEEIGRRYASLYQELVG